MSSLLSHPNIFLLYPCFSNLSVPWNHLEDLVNRLLVCIPEFLIYQICFRTIQFSFRTSFQMMLVGGPHYENYYAFPLCFSHMPSRSPFHFTFKVRLGVYTLSSSQGCYEFQMIVNCKECYKINGKLVLLRYRLHGSQSMSCSC